MIEFDYLQSKVSDLLIVHTIQYIAEFKILVF